MEEFIIAIPSYKRAEKQQTVEYFSGLGFPKEKIFVFVQTEDDWKAYQKYSREATLIYAEADGIAKARNNILRHFDGAENVLMCDDDISSIGRLRGEKIEAIRSREEMEETIGRCFGFAKKKGAPIFGLYPVSNAFFMSENISTAVTVNTVVGFTAGSRFSFNETYRAKEDIELCARILSLGGKVIRYNFLAMDAKHRTNAGGCHDTWKSNENTKAAARLCNTYPNILARHSKKPEEVRVIAKDKKIEMYAKGGKR